MNARKTLALIGAGLAIVIAQTANAASAPNAKLWGGAWKLNMAKSKFSVADTAEKGETRSYTVSGNRLTMRSSATTSAGKAMKWSYSAATDGKWYPTVGNPNTDHIALIGNLAEFVNLTLDRAVINLEVRVHCELFPRVLYTHANRVPKGGVPVGNDHVPWAGTAHRIRAFPARAGLVSTIAAGNSKAEGDPQRRHGN